MTTIVDRLSGVSASVAVKAPCKAMSTTALTLYGEQTVGGVSCTAGDRVLYALEGGSVDNGIWVVSVSAWTRAKDFDGARDVVSGTTVLVSPGSNAHLWQVSTAGDIVIGTTALEFTQIDDFLSQSDVAELLAIQTALQGPRVFPLWDGLSFTSVQVQGPADMAASLGTLGFVFNAASEAAASTAFINGNPDALSTINGASTAGVWSYHVLQTACESVHIGFNLMPAPADGPKTSGPLLEGSSQFMRLDFSLSDNVLAVAIYEGPPTDYSGAPGTGSARLVVVMGISVS